MSRLHAYGLSLLLLGLVSWPAFRDPPQDSFPLSDFPMFSEGRPSPIFTISQALGVTANDEREPLSPMISAANREVLQSMVTIARGLHGNRQAFCREIAARVAADDDLDHVVAVEVATSTFDGVAYFAEAPVPVRRVVHVRCEVER